MFVPQTKLISPDFLGVSLEREKARQRTYDAMVRKAKAGHVCGGRTFGYDNLCSACGRVIPAGKRRCCTEGHTEKRINDQEAAVVRRIFDLCATGTGYTRIAKQLNAEQAPNPRPQQGRPAGWSPSTVQEVLKRPLYRGQAVWNKSRKRDQWGQTDTTARPPRDWITIDAPQLRIVTEDAWQAAHGRLTDLRARLGSHAARTEKPNSPQAIDDVEAAHKRPKLKTYDCPSAAISGLNQDIPAVSNEKSLRRVR